MSAPSSAITVTLRSAAGDVKSTATKRTTADGRYSAWFGGFAEDLRTTGPTIEPGDTIHLETSAGDPTILRVPRLDLVPLPAEQRFLGRAPSGTVVTVGVGRAVYTATAAADGTVEVGAVTSAAFVPGAFGAVSYDVAGVATFTDSWVSNRLTIFDTSVGGSAPPGREVTVRVTTKDGLLLDERSVRVAMDTAPASVRHWSIGAEDLTGGLPRLNVGDAVTATIGGEVRSTTVPPLRVEPSVAEHVVRGTTSPGRAVAVTIVYREGSKPIESTTLRTRAASDGSFALDFSAVLRFGHDAQIETAVEDAQGNRFVRSSRSSSLWIDLDQNAISGWSAPDTPHAVELRRDGRRVDARTLRTDVAGAFVLGADEPSGAFGPLVQGDVIVVRNIVAGTPVLTATVPAFVVAERSQPHVLEGIAAPLAELDFAAQTVFLRSGTDGVGASGEATARAAADGTFRLAVPDPRTSGGWLPHRGMRVTAQQRTVEGHRVTRSTQRPIVSVEVGGASVCGIAPRLTEVAIGLERPGDGIVGTARSATNAEGRWEAALYDTRGAPIAVRTGDTVRLRTGGDDVVMVVPLLDVSATMPEYDAKRGVDVLNVRGAVEPNAPYYVRAPFEGCFTGAGAPAAGLYIDGTAGATGLFAATAPLPAVGDGVQVSTFDANGDRAYRVVRRGQLTLFAGTRDFVVTAMPRTAVSLTVRSAAGAMLGSAAGGGDAFGVVRGAFDSPTGAVTRAGQRVSADIGGERCDLEVPPLDFDFDGRTLWLQAPPGAMVEVELTDSRGGQLRMNRRTDAGGNAAVYTAAYEARAAWRGADVTRVWIATVLACGHRLVMERLFDARSVASSVYLPVSYRSRR
ncbi:MAG: hypothetical protein ABI780_13455 [Ardenticatenales bacterium]